MMATLCLHFIALLRRFLLSAACLAFVAQVHAGLIAHYKFDETSGTTAADSSGNGNTGTLTNMSGSEWATGKVGGALDINQNNAHINLGTTLGNNITDATFAAWIYHYGKVSNWSGQEILSKSGVYKFEITPTNHSRGANKLMVLFGDGSSYYQTASTAVSSSAVPANQWVHIAGTREITGVGLLNSTVKVYIDGSLAGTGNNDEVGTNSNLTSIGATMGVFNEYTGLLDDLRIYDNALSASEISALAAMGGGVAPVPEPASVFASLGLLTAAGCGLREWRRRKKQV